MGLLDGIMNSIANRVAALLQTDENRERLQHWETWRKYTDGEQRPALKVKPGQYDDNVIINLVDAIVNRSISMLFGDGIVFWAAEEADKEREYLDALWRANKLNLWTYALGQNGSTFGTAFVKIVPDALVDLQTGLTVPELVVLDSETVTIEAAPGNRNRVEKYIIKWTEGDQSLMEITRRATDADYEIIEGQTAPDAWVVEYYRLARGAKWELERAESWPYAFPPVQHVKNLPKLRCIYGKSDVESAIMSQDKINLVASNIGKIIRYHAHPRTIGLGVDASQIKTVGVGTDQMYTTTARPGDAQIFNLEMQSDLASSRQYWSDLQRTLYAASRTVDTASIADKVGQLTNFGLRVLYQDALAKNDTKRALYGDFLTAMAGNLLELAGLKVVPVAIVWPDAMVSNEVEKAQMVREDFAAGLISKRTALSLRGYDPEEELPIIEEEKAAAQNVGALLLGDFFAGK